MVSREEHHNHRNPEVQQEVNTKEMKEAAPKDVPVRESKSTKWCYNGKKVLISYADEKRTGIKIVLVLAAMFNVMRVSKNQRKKPEPLFYYGHMKEGVNVVDLVSFDYVKWCFDEDHNKAMDSGYQTLSPR